jgi:pyruvate/2-oxoglutarate dehydrogenase complex dihydrolipoamide acyltransferase (E2) component
MTITAAEARRRYAAKKAGKRPRPKADARALAYIARMREGESQTDIARKDGLDPSTVSACVRGYRRRHPDVVVPTAHDFRKSTRACPEANLEDPLSFFTEAERERFTWIEARLAVLMAEVSPLRIERRHLDGLRRGRHDQAKKRRTET